MTTATTPSRIDRIKRRQAAAAAGRTRSVAAPETTHASVAEPPMPKDGLAPIKQEASGESLNALFGGLGVSDGYRALLLKQEFLETLEAVAVLHRYEEEDKEFVKNFLLRPGVDLATNQQARDCLAEHIRGWHIDLISMGWVPQEGQEMLRHRAMSTFRRAAMGLVRDENGELYAGVRASQFEDSVEKAGEAQQTISATRAPGIKRRRTRP